MFLVILDFYSDECGPDGYVIDGRRPKSFHVGGRGMLQVCVRDNREQESPLPQRYEEGRQTGVY